MIIHKVFLIIKNGYSYHKCNTCKISYRVESEFIFDHSDCNVDVKIFDLRIKTLKI